MLNLTPAIRSSGRLCGLGAKGTTRQRSSFSAILTLHRAKVEIHFSRISVDAARPARPFYRSDITARETKYSTAEAGLARILCNSENFGINTQTVVKHNSLQGTAQRKERCMSKVVDEVIAANKKYVSTFGGKKA
jgi:hypothetical protein